MDMTLERLYQNFEIMDDWQDRYRFIIELGKKLPPLPEEAKVEENRVHGCMSTVYMTMKENESQPGTVEFAANSDALIVNGLIAILQIIYSNKTPEEIRAVDIDGIFAKLGLDGHISPNRRNGFFSMVERLKNLSNEVIAHD